MMAEVALALPVCHHCLSELTDQRIDRAARLSQRKQRVPDANRCDAGSRSGSLKKLRNAGALAGLVCAFWAAWACISRATRATWMSVQVPALQIVVVLPSATSAEEVRA